LEPARVDEVLASELFADDVQTDLSEARELGISGVPFYVFDRRLAVSGAQPVELFADALERAWRESRPRLRMVRNDAASTAGDRGADPAETACGPDGCAVEPV
jgi:predicted DsbA family dithiol-disulfide isomerase